MSKGAWLLPGTAKPNEGNTVISAHRFQFLPPAKNTFYHLDKVEIEDYVTIYWQGEEYDYQVVKKEVVEPNSLLLAQKTSFSQLTLYTCTPLWTAAQRLVVIANPI